MVIDKALINEYLLRIRRLRPVVQCITNIVTVNDCANALLAIGASPTMAHHPEEMADFAAISNALVCNMGATESLEAMMAAAKLADKAGHPLIIDPVGCAGSAFRRKKCLDLIRQARPSCIRGNAAEIHALARNCNTGRGVDDLFSSDESHAGTSTDSASRSLHSVKESARILTKNTGAIVIASGSVDIAALDDTIFELHGGSALLPRITGSGCMLSSLLGAFLAAEDSLTSAACCCAFMSLCGEQAEAWTAEAGKGTGTFHTALLDALSLSADLFG